MQNPGLQKHGAPPPMAQPKTLWNEPVGPTVEELSPTSREDMATPPSPTGVNTPAPASAANGAPPMVNPAAEQARITRQQTPGGGAKENPAWTRAHESIQEKMQARRAHPLHQGSSLDEVEPDVSVLYSTDADPTDQQKPACETCYMRMGLLHTEPMDHGGGGFNHLYKPLVMEPGQRFSGYDDRRRQFLYDIDAGPDYYKSDVPPSAYGYSNQSMFKIKEPLDDQGNLRMEEPHEHPAWQGCETCLNLNDQGDLYGPYDAVHQNGHKYKPIEDLPPGVRLASSPSGWDSIDPPEENVSLLPGGSGIHSSGPMCETCWLNTGHKKVFPSGHADGSYGHEFKPLEMESGQRFSAYDHERGEFLYDLDHPHYPYSGDRTSDYPPSYISDTSQPMFQEKRAIPYGNTRHLPDDDILNNDDVDWESEYSENQHSREKRDWLEGSGHKTLAGTWTPAKPGDTPGELEPWARHSALYPKGEDRENGLEYYRDTDFPPNENGDRYTAQPMFRIKDDSGAGKAVNYSPGDQCETCCLRDGGVAVSAQQHAEKSKFSYEPGHKFKRMPPSGAGERYSAAGSDDPIYPFRGWGEGEPEDTVDEHNLQSGDDTSRPHLNPKSLDPTLEGINRVINQGDENDTPDDERGRAAHADAMNTILDSLHDGGTLEDAKRAIDVHYETGQLAHKDHVKRLHDDWLARGGHKTGEPRPVEKFSPRFTKPQRIVPDPNNIFPELTSPINHVGKCEGCGKNLFDSADSSGDPRGALGDYTVGTLDAAEYDARDVPRSERTGDRRMHGPSALICPSCEQDQDKHNRIEDKYLGHKAGDPTGGFHWTRERQPDGSYKSVRVDHTHATDRKGKWHNPGEKPGECYECDHGISEFHRRHQAKVSAFSAHLLHRFAEVDEEDPGFDAPEFDMPQIHKDWFESRGWTPREVRPGHETFAPHYTKMSPSGIRHSLYWDGRRAWQNNQPVYQLESTIPSKQDSSGVRNVQSDPNMVFETHDPNEVENKARENEKAWLTGEHNTVRNPGLLKFMDDPDHGEYDRRFWDEPVDERPARSIGDRAFVEPKEKLHPLWRGGPEGRSGLGKLNAV